MFGLTAYAEIITGQFLLSLGALFYTGWWLTAFRPDARSEGALSALLFLLLAVFGLSGTALTVHGIHGLPLPPSWPGGTMLLALALLVYFILLAGSVKLFGRKPTTELILLVLWALMESWYWECSMKQAALRALPMVSPGPPWLLLLSSPLQPI